MLKSLPVFVAATLALGLPSLHAQDATAGLEKAGADGFISLFNGKDLTGWEGLPGLWSVKDGVIDGSETKEKSVQTDLILTASKEHPEQFANFELHVKFQFVTPAGNSGVQFRSAINKPETLHVGGYQADVDASSGHTGCIYDESGIAGGRATMSTRGEKTTWDAENVRHNEPLSESGADLKALLHASGAWNDIVLIANGNHIKYSINGHLMTELIDESPKAVLKGGVIALQMHAGYTMNIQYKDLAIKFLDGKP